MNILWLRPNKSENVSTHCYRIAEELEKRGHTVEIQNTTPSSFFGVESNDPDVIIGTTRLGAMVGAWQKIRNGTPLVVEHVDPIDQLRRTHGRITTWATSQLEKACFWLSDHTLVVYEREAPRVQRYTSNVTMTSLGVDYDLFSSPPEKAVQQAEETLSDRIPSDENILAYIGGLEPIYNLDKIVEAMDHLPGWHFVILGDGSQREWLEKIDRNRNDIHYLGTVSQEVVSAYLNLATVGISLVDDPNTLKVLEYGASGLPVVHIRGSAEKYFGDGVTFCLNKPEKIAEAIYEAKTSNVDVLRDLAKRHRWDRITDDYEEAINQSVILD